MKVRFFAEAHFSNGHVEDRSDTVVWSSSDETVARFVPSSTVGAFVDPGSDGKALENYVAGLLKK